MKLPKVDVSSEKLYRMCYASIRTKLLVAAIELKIFNHLSTDATAEEIAGAIGGHIENTRLFLNGLAACELVVKQEGVYRNAPIAQAFLVEDTPTSLGAGFIRQAAMSDRMLDDLTGLVKNGPPAQAPGAGAEDEKKWSRHATWMANNARAGIAQQMSRMVSALPEFPSFEKMLDLGGGPGIFGIAMVERHPSMKGVVFDRAPVTDVARSFIREHGLENRMSALSGDYNKDPIGSGYDLIWASATLNFAQDNMDAVMTKIHDALNPGGVFINLSEGLTHEGTRPDFYVLCTLGWTLNNPLTAFDQGVVADAMLDAGFRSVKSRTVQTGWGPMDLDIARKS